MPPFTVFCLVPMTICVCIYNVNSFFLLRFTMKSPYNISRDKVQTCQKNQTWPIMQQMMERKRRKERKTEKKGKKGKRKKREDKNSGFRLTGILWSCSDEPRRGLLPARKVQRFQDISQNFFVTTCSSSVFEKSFVLQAVLCSLDILHVILQLTITNHTSR